MAVKIQDPAIDAIPITPNDSADIPDVSIAGETRKARALYVGTVGAVKITTIAGNVRIILAVVGLYPVQVTRVWATSTTATNISALY